jgi:hypothetical protein
VRDLEVSARREDRRRDERRFSRQPADSRRLRGDDSEQQKEAVVVDQLGHADVLPAAVRGYTGPASGEAEPR